MMPGFRDTFIAPVVVGRKYAADPESMTEEIRRACRLAIDAGSIAEGATLPSIRAGAAELGVPVVWGAVLVTRAQVSVFWSRPRTPEGPVPGITLRDLHPEPPDPATWVTLMSRPAIMRFSMLREYMQRYGTG